MERITITVEDDLLEQFDAFRASKGYATRSEALRDVLRDRLERDRLETTSAPTAVGCLTYVYDHGERELPKRLVSAQHAHHDLSLSTLHLHLDHENCLEATLLRGPTAEVVAFANAVIAERGVRHGHLWLVPVEMKVASHRHPPDRGGSADPHPEAAHVHSRPKT